MRLLFYSEGLIAGTQDILSSSKDVRSYHPGLVTFLFDLSFPDNFEVTILDDVNMGRLMPLLKHKMVQVVVFDGERVDNLFKL